jgi:16S rRNA (guanine966-N2)-methyltransferase
MRITGGILKSREITVSKKAGKLRPTTDKVRSALFSSLGDIEGKTFLDLFAGTGTVGIEALSRGARSAVFFDIDTRSLEQNIRLIPAGTEFQIIKADAAQAGKLLSGKLFDIIYIDPPYGIFRPAELLLLMKDRMAQDAVTAYEESVRTLFTVPEGFYIYKEKRYGDTVIRYIKKADGLEDTK